MVEEHEDGSLVGPDLLVMPWKLGDTDGWAVWVATGECGMCRLWTDGELGHQHKYAEQTDALRYFPDRESAECAVAVWRLRHGG